MPNTNNFNLNLNDVFDLVYPIGTLYTTQDERFNPNNSFVGTWEQVKDRFILACGDKYKIGQSGGESEVTLTANELPKHNHAFENKSPLYDVNQQGGFGCSIQNHGSSLYVAMAKPEKDVGGSKAHNNMPPYVTAFIWKRIS